MLDECRPEAVIVVGTPQMHYELGLEVAARGMNLFVEKPPAPSAGEARRLARRVAAAGHAGMVGTMLRHTTAIRLLKDLMRQEEFGDGLFCSGRLFAPGPVSDDYYRLGSAPQAYLGSQAIHLIDCMRFLMGEVTEVTARLGTRGDAFSFAAGLAFASGAVGVLGCTSHAAALETEIVVGGSGGQTAIVTNAKELRVIGSSPAGGVLGGYADVPSWGWNQGYTYAGTLRHGYLEELHAFAIVTRLRQTDRSHPGGRRHLDGPGRSAVGELGVRRGGPSGSMVHRGRGRVIVRAAKPAGRRWTGMDGRARLR